MQMNGNSEKGDSILKLMFKNNNNQDECPAPQRNKLVLQQMSSGCLRQLGRKCGFQEFSQSCERKTGCEKREKIRSWSSRWAEVLLIPIEIEHFKLAWHKNNQGCGVDLLTIFPAA